MSSVKREAFGHAKFRLVARDLGIPVFSAYGLIASIWNTTSLRFPRGDIGRLSNEEIAAEIEGYVEDADRLVEVLVKRRLLDQHPEHRLVVHDWSEHADDTVHWKVASIGNGTFADGTPSKRINAKDRRSGKPFRRGEARSLPHDPPTTTETLGASPSDSETPGDHPKVSVSPSPSPSPSHSVDTTEFQDSTVGAAGADDDDPRSDFDIENGIGECDCPLPDYNDLPPAAPPPDPPRKSDPRGARIPEDFELTSMRRERALLLGLPADMVQDTFDEFVAYWTALPGKAARKLNWDLTWDNRCRAVAAAIRARGAHRGALAGHRAASALRLAAADQSDANFDTAVEARRGS